MPEQEVLRYVWSSSDPTAHRLVWDPAVHEYFEERCYIYLIAVRREDAEGTISDDVRSLLSSLEIRSGTVHAVFGTFDILLRFWGSGGARLRFLRGLQQSKKLQVQGVREFTSHLVNYGIRRHEPPERYEISRSRDLIEEAVRAERSNPGSPIRDELARSLIERRLVQPVQPCPGVKFFVFMHYTSDRDTQPSAYVINELTRVASEDGNTRGFSIYAGSGFADYIVKAVASDYYAVLQQANAFRRSAKHLKMDPWTLPVADYGRVPVGETIDSLGGALSPELEALIAAQESLQDQKALRQNVWAMSANNRHALGQLLDQVRPGIPDADVDRFDEIVRACILRNRKDVNRSASFLLSIEDDLRYFLPRFLRKHLGEDWLARIASIRPGNDAGNGAWIAPNSGPRDWSLYQLMRVLSEAKKHFDAELGEELAEVLPDGWNANIRAIQNLRDTFAHGKIMDAVRDGSFDGKLGEMIMTFVIASRLQSALETQVEHW